METIKINMNKELNGIELTFSQKPDIRILDTLKAAGFHWHRIKKIWYAKKSEATLQVIAELRENPTRTVMDDEPKPTDMGSKKENLDGVKIGDLYVASWGSRTVSFKTDGGMLAPINTATFIKNQLQGDRKSTKNSTIKLTDYAYAHKYDGSELYNSWYA